MLPSYQHSPSRRRATNPRQEFTNMNRPLLPIGAHLMAMRSRRWLQCFTTKLVLSAMSLVVIIFFQLVQQQQQNHENSHSQYIIATTTTTNNNSYSHYSNIQTTPIKREPFKFTIPPPQLTWADRCPMYPIPTLLKIAIVSSYLPRHCGIATFAFDMRQAFLKGFTGNISVDIIAMNDISEGYEYDNSAVKFQIRQNSISDYRRAAEFVNANKYDFVIVEHEYGIYGGVDGEYILEFLHHTKVPKFTVLHTVMKKLMVVQREVVRNLIHLSDRVVVLSASGCSILSDYYGVTDLAHTTAGRFSESFNPSSSFYSSSSATASASAESFFEQKCIHIPHGVINLPFLKGDTGDGTARLKEYLGFAGKKLIVTFGLLVPDKGIQYMIRGMRHVIQDHPDAIYLILGQSHPYYVATAGHDYALDLAKLAEENLVSEHVYFLNHFISTEDLALYLMAADIYVTPYLNTDQISSGTLTFAMAAGAAVISTKYTYAIDMLSGGGRGVLVPNLGDSHALGMAAAKLLSSPKVLHQMQTNAFRHTRSFVWEIVAYDYLCNYIALRQEYSGGAGQKQKQLQQQQQRFREQRGLLSGFVTAWESYVERAPFLPNPAPAIGSSTLPSWSDVLHGLEQRLSSNSTTASPSPLSSTTPHSDSEEQRLSEVLKLVAPGGLIFEKALGINADSDQIIHVVEREWYDPGSRGQEVDNRNDKKEKETGVLPLDNFYVVENDIVSLYGTVNDRAIFMAYKHQGEVYGKPFMLTGHTVQFQLEDGRRFWFLFGGNIQSYCTRRVSNREAYIEIVDAMMVPPSTKATSNMRDIEACRATLRVTLTSNSPLISVSLGVKANPKFMALKNVRVALGLDHMSSVTKGREFHVVRYMTQSGKLLSDDIRQFHFLRNQGSSHIVHTREYKTDTDDYALKWSCIPESTNKISPHAIFNIFSRTNPPLILINEGSREAIHWHRSFYDLGDLDARQQPNRVATVHEYKLVVGRLWGSKLNEYDRLIDMLSSRDSKGTALARTTASAAGPPEPLDLTVKSSVGPLIYAVAHYCRATAKETTTTATTATRTTTTTTTKHDNTTSGSLPRFCSPNDNYDFENWLQAHVSAVLQEISATSEELAYVAIVISERLTSNLAEMSQKHRDDVFGTLARIGMRLLEHFVIDDNDLVVKGLLACHKDDKRTFSIECHTTTMYALARIYGILYNGGSGDSSSSSSNSNSNTNTNINIHREAADVDVKARYTEALLAAFNAVQVKGAAASSSSSRQHQFSAATVRLATKKSVLNVVTRAQLAWLIKAMQEVHMLHLGTTMPEFHVVDQLNMLI